MEKEIKALITKLMAKNNERSVAMNNDKCSEYGHTVLVHEYNNTLDIVKQLEKIVNDNKPKGHYLDDGRGFIS